MPLSELTFNLIALQVFTGLGLGAINVLIALGLSLIFGMLRVVNFAHGAFVMVGAYAGYAITAATGHFWLALLAGPLAVAALGLVTERLIIRPIEDRGPDYPLLATFGLSYVLVELARLAFGKVGLPFEAPALLQGTADIGIGYFPVYRLFVIAVTALAVAALFAVLERTRLGLIIRAGVRDSVIVRVLGVDMAKVRAGVFGLGSALAGLAGVLAAPLQGVAPEMGSSMLITAFVVTVTGGMGSLAGAVAAGLLTGIVTSLASLVVPEMGVLKPQAAARSSHSRMASSAAPNGENEIRRNT